MSERGWTQREEARERERERMEKKRPRMETEVKKRCGGSKEQ